MNSHLTHLAALEGMGMYEPLDHFGSWGEAFKGGKNPIMDASMIVQEDATLDKKFEYTPHESIENSRSDQEASKNDKVLRRQAQNREAARKSRLRKKAYVQQLESSRLKLAQLEQELDKARQGMYLSNGIDTGYGFSKRINQGIAAFEMEYGHWVEEHNRKMCELRSALQAQVGDIELRTLVDNGLKHYQDLFRMKADAAKVDVFYIMSGIWRTSAERFFLWIGGFRPSELLNVISVLPKRMRKMEVGPETQKKKNRVRLMKQAEKVLQQQIEPLTDKQLLGVSNLQQSSRQAEDALSLGMDKLQQTLAQEVAANQLGAGKFGYPLAAAMEKLEALENFVSQADHLRQQTMLHMSRILTTRQAARALVALGEYFHRLRALSTLWAARPHETT